MMPVLLNAGGVIPAQKSCRREGKSGNPARVVGLCETGRSRRHPRGGRIPAAIASMGPASFNAEGDGSVECQAPDLPQNSDDAMRQSLRQVEHHTPPRLPPQIRAANETPCHTIPPDRSSTFNHHHRTTADRRQRRQCLNRCNWSFDANRIKDNFRSGTHSMNSRRVKGA